MADRKLHINNSEWKYKIGIQYVVIHSPEGKRFNISINNLWFKIYGFYPDIEEYLEITPSIIKSYIEKELI